MPPKKPINNELKNNRMFEQNINNKGEIMVIVEYYMANEIFVSFSDGTLVKTCYKYFLKGSTQKPIEERIGKQRKNNAGFLMTIIEYLPNTNQNIVVSFEDGSTKKSNYAEFLSGKIKKPFENKIGERKLNKQNQWMTIGYFNSPSDVTIVFDDGTLTKTTIYNFNFGGVRKPITNRIGQQNLNNQGELMTIINYSDSKNMVIEFEDGTRTEKGIYGDFVSGLIANPKTKIGGTSLAEKEIFLFIKETTKNKVINNYNKWNGRKELDIFIPKLNISFEYNGLYWHSDIHKEKTYHITKTLQAKKLGIELFHIFEDEWEYKKEIVKSRIKNVLGLTENKIYARKTKVKQITFNDAKYFLAVNHLQGKTNGVVFLGLFYFDELVSVMVFSNPNKYNGHKTEEDKYELSRFANKLNLNVVGGASKLLKYFETNFKPKEIISFADRCWSTGKLYETLGFSASHLTKPNYMYFKLSSNIREHKFKFNKKTLIAKGYNPNKTEELIMRELGYYKIYDCGKIHFFKKYHENGEQVKYNEEKMILVEENFYDVNIKIKEKYYRTSIDRLNLINKNMSEEEKFNIIRDSGRYKEYISL